ncbi:MAG TPA: hypothetical protein VGV93_09485 [Acidimicrobiales bacterium]|nr:hypothetical protein [Acidimicrobiales bacterium]
MAVVRLGALCELESEAPRQASFRVSEYAVLDDGTEVVLHSARGFATVVLGSVGVWHHLTAAGIERDVMTVVLPDDAEETGDNHPWEWLVSLLAHAGVTETVDHLRGLPYEVRIAPDVIFRLEPRDT